MSIKPVTTLLLVLMLLAAPVQASAFRWLDTEGDIHSLQEFRGKPVLLHFWASWCPPCRAEMPELTDWIKQHPDIPIIAISLDRSLADAEAFMQTQAFPLPIRMTSSSEATRLGVRGLPTTMIINAEGETEQMYIGAQNWQNEKFLQQLRTGLHL